MLKFNLFEEMIPKINFGFSRENKDFLSNDYGIYFAPEILTNDKYTSKVTLWSIGILIYYMYLKEFPFDIPDFKDLNDIKQKFNTKKKKKIEDQYLDDLIDKLLIYDPNERINWNEYFDHSFFKSKLYKRFSGKQFIEIIVNIEIKNDNKIYLLNDGNLCELYVNPIKFNELNEHNTDMYIDGILTKFKRYFYINEKNNDNNDDSNSNNNNNDNNKKHVKYVFDHKLKRLDFMFFACENIISVKFVNVDTSLVESMAYMFSGCYELRDVDFTCFNTKNLKNIFNCFFASGGIKEINFSNFDFSNLDISNIFNYGAVFGRTGIGKILVSKNQDKNKIEKIFEHVNIEYI